MPPAALAPPAPPPTVPLLLSVEIEQVTSVNAVWAAVDNAGAVTVIDPPVLRIGPATIVEMVWSTPVQAACRARRAERGEHEERGAGEQRRARAHSACWR